MKKRLSILLLVMSAMLILTACSKEDPDPSSSPEPARTTVEPTETPAETETPEPEATPRPDTGDKPDFGPLTDDIFDFQVEINGDVYQFPMTYAQFCAFGWDYKDDDSEMLDAKYYTVGERFTLDDMECTVHILNLAVNSQPFKDCLVAGIDLDWYMTRNLEKPEDLSIVMAKGIEFDKSTADEVRDAYGTPTYENKLDSGTEVVEYKLDYDRQVKFTFDAETGLLSNIVIRNFVEPEGFEAGEISGEVPEIVTKYAAPGKMSDDFADWIVEYGGKLYELPAPVSEFVDDGWVVDENESETAIDGRGSGWMTMRKDNQKLKIIVRNFSTEATGVENCFVERVLSDPYDTKIDLIVSKGITIGTSEADLKAAIAGLEVEESDSSSYRYYKVMPTERLTEGYDFLVSKDTGLVYKIEVKVDPKFDDYVNR